MKNYIKLKLKMNMNLIKKEINLQDIIQILNGIGGKSEVVFEIGYL